MHVDAIKNLIRTRVFLGAEEVICTFETKGTKSNILTKLQNNLYKQKN